MKQSSKKLLIGVAAAISTAAVTVTALANSLSAVSANMLPKGSVLFSANEFNDLKGVTAEDVAYVNAGAAELNLTWGQLEETEGEINWDLIDQYIDLYKAADRKVALRLSTAYFQPDDTPRWLFNDYGVRRIYEEDYLFESFDQEEDVFQLGSGGGAKSNLAKNAPTDQEGNYVWGTGELVTTGLKAFPTDCGQSIGFDYKAVSDGTLIIKARDSKGEETVLAEYAFQAGEKGSKVFDASAAQVGGNHEIVWEYEGSAVALDNLTIGCDRAGWYGGGTMMYPNYFDETFYEKYADFIYRVAEHYKDEDTLAAVSVGGFGVYSEPSLNGDLGQWEAYGYSLDRYMEHIERCVDLFKDAFGDSKTVILSAYLEVLPGGYGSDPLYLSNKLINYAVDNGVAIKTNSQQAMLTEHGGESGIYWAYAINRYKHRDDVLIFHETAAQCANPDTASYSGHPLSMVNRYLIDGTDYYWRYEADLYDDFGAKYMHFANEQAGSGVLTNMFIRFGIYNYYQNDGTSTHHFENIMNGIWLRDNGNFYEEVDGVQALSLDTGEFAELSIDDRQKYNSMYGSVITVRYLDVEDGSFEISLFEEDDGDVNGKLTTLGKVETTGTNTWKTASFYAPANWGRSQRNSGNDMSVEMLISNLSEEAIVYFTEVDVDYVPSREWDEEVLKASGETETTKDLNGQTITVAVPDGKRLSSLMVPVKTMNEIGKSDMIARVKAVLSTGEKVDVTAKEFYMASEKRDELIIPVSEAPSNTVSFEITMETLEGSMAAFCDASGNIAVELRGYADEKDSDSILYDGGIYEAAEPFYGIAVDKTNDGKTFVLSRYMNGSWQKVEEGVVYSGLAGFEPQTSGYYKLEIDGKGVTGTLKAMTRLEEAKKPTRYLLGSSVAEGFTASNGAMWTPTFNFKDIETLDKDGFTALLNGQNPTIESAALSVEANAEQIFHFVMKNETGSNYLKVYWKTTDNDTYTEANSALIPVVANDTEFREYSWPIGEEANYSGTITGLKVMPVTGDSSTGRISIQTMELRNGKEDVLKGAIQELKLSDVADGSAGTLFKTDVKQTDTDMPDLPSGGQNNNGEGNVTTGVPAVAAGCAAVAVLISGAVLVGIKRRKAHNR